MGTRPSWSTADDPATQVSQIENLITQGVNALIIAAIDNKSLNKVLQQAADANIPVISYDRLILGTKNVTSSFDNEQVGRLQARFIIDKLGLEHGKVPVRHRAVRRLQRRQQHQVLLQRRLAPSAAVPGQQATRRPVRRDRAQPGHHPALGRCHRAEADEQHPRHFVQDEDGGRGPVAVRRHIHRRPGGAQVGRLRLPQQAPPGHHGAGRRSAGSSIIAGQQAQTVYKDSRLLADVAANMVDDVLNKRKPQLNDTRTYDNGAKVVAYLLQPISVDKTNYDSVLVTGGYYTDAELK